jgi:hypothetical protein
MPMFYVLIWVENEYPSAPAIDAKTRVYGPGYDPWSNLFLSFFDGFVESNYVTVLLDKIS